MTVKLDCPVCGSMGTLMQKTTTTKTTTGEYKQYRYWYIYHGKKAKKPWCYLSKEDLEIPEIREGIMQATQITTQTNTVTTQTENNRNLGFIQQNKLVNPSLSVLLANTRQQYKSSRIG